MENHLFLGQFSLQPIIIFVFVLSFTVFPSIQLENAVGGSLVGQFHQYLAKTSLRYLSTVTNNLLCVQSEKKSAKN
jgi:hypothetical protein